MIKITKQDDKFIFDVQNAHKLWALKSQLTIPVSNIKAVHQNLDELPKYKGLRMPGTYIPFLITAGTYYKEGEKYFWDVVNKDKTIIVELNDEDYSKLVIEVDDPAAAIELLTAQ